MSLSSGVEGGRLQPQAPTTVGAETVAVVTADKLGTRSPFMVAPAERLATVGTEATASETALAPFRKLNPRVVTA